MAHWYEFLFGDPQPEDEPVTEPAKPEAVREVDCRKCFAIVDRPHCEDIDCGWFFCAKCRITIDTKGRWLER